MRQLDRYRNKSGQIWVNVASSTYVLEDFVNLDNHVFLRISQVFPFMSRCIPLKYHEHIQQYREARGKAQLLKHDCRQPLFFPNGSVDHILCSHFLEHIYPDEMQRNLCDFYRVIKRGGTVHIIVPDLEAQVQRYADRRRQNDPHAAAEFIEETLLSRKTRGSLAYRTLEFMGSFGLQHRWMYDSASMRASLEGVGFEILEGNETPSKSYRFNDDSVHVVARKPV